MSLNIDIFLSIIVCPATVPDVANGIVSSGDSAPYFINEMITYECNNNYDADGADLTNECMENAGDIVVPAVWSRMTGDLTDICRAGIDLLMQTLIAFLRILLIVQCMFFRG